MRGLEIIVALGSVAGLTACLDEIPAVDLSLDAGFVLPADSGVADTGVDLGFPYSFAANVAPILEARCQGCHANPPRNLAPRPLVTYADLTAIDAESGQPVHVLVADRVSTNPVRMPPPSSGIALSATEIAILTTWSLTGAP